MARPKKQQPKECDTKGCPNQAIDRFKKKWLCRDCLTGEEFDYPPPQFSALDLCGDG